MKRKDSFLNKDFTEIVSTKHKKDTVIACLGVLCLLQQFSLMNSDVEVVVSPENFYKELRVSSNQANEHYQTQHAWSITALVGNVNPTNVDFVTDRISKMLSPFLRSQMEESLKAEARILKVRKATQRFVIEDLMYDPKREVTFIWGKKHITTTNRHKDEMRWTYELRIKPYNGSPRITHFDAYKGTPRIKNQDYTVDAKPFLSEELARVQQTTNPEHTVYMKANTNPIEITKESNNDTEN